MDTVTVTQRYVNLCLKCKAKNKEPMNPVRVVGDYLTGKTICHDCGHVVQTMMYRYI